MFITVRQQSWLHRTNSRTLCLSSWRPRTSRNEGQLLKISRVDLHTEKNAKLACRKKCKKAHTLLCDIREWSPFLVLHRAQPHPQCSDGWLNIYFEQWYSVDMKWEKNNLGCRFLCKLPSVLAKYCWISNKHKRLHFTKWLNPSLQPINTDFICGSKSAA